MSKASAPYILVVVMLLAFAVIAEAQQKNKIPLSAFLSRPAKERATRGFGGDYWSWATWRNKISYWNNAPRMRSLPGSANLPASWLNLNPMSFGHTRSLGAGS
jgi:hypothetical protein